MMVPCTHPGCDTQVDLPAHFTNGRLLDLAARAVLCDRHVPPDENGATAAPALTSETTWTRRVPHQIIDFYGKAPTLHDVPDTIPGINVLRQIAETWPSPVVSPGPTPSSLVFGGPTGSLKTTTAYALIGDMVRRSAHPEQHHTSVLAATEHDLLSDHWNERGFPVPSDPRRPARRADIVLVDDVGLGRWTSETSRLTAWKSLMDVVYDHKKFLVLTTNLSTERALWEHIGAATFSRLVHLFGRTLPDGFRAPTSNNPADDGYWPTPLRLLIIPSPEDHRMTDGAQR